ncbi:hypothetical protein NH44784_011291 [Achromobacter xylosoxidans NH44784-1996]|nr:hypothetical protein NH44784_011291 [Achromobacter xylosoxidans NH44784-1996]
MEDTDDRRQAPRAGSTGPRPARAGRGRPVRACAGTGAMLPVSGSRRGAPGA